MRWIGRHFAALAALGASAAAEEARPPIDWNALQPGDVFQECAVCPRMVVIAGGSVEMRALDGETWTVYVARFAMAETETTVGAYRRYVAETGARTYDSCGGIAVHAPDGVSAMLDWRMPGYEPTEEDPVVCLSPLEAEAYADWLGAKTEPGAYRLALSAEFEYARVAGATTAYPWGDRLDDACAFANVGDQSFARVAAPILLSWAKEALHCDDGFAYAAPVGSFAPNAFGLYDLSGNASEILADCWPPSRPSPALLPAPSVAGCDTVAVRGGDWRSNGGRFDGLRIGDGYGVHTGERDRREHPEWDEAFIRREGESRHAHRGFRVVRALPQATAMRAHDVLE